MPRIVYAATSLFACTGTVALAAPANARHSHHHSHFTYAHTRSFAPFASARPQTAYRMRRAASRATRRTRGASGSVAVLGGRPAGCPHSYCGCGVSLKVFGRIRPELNLAWNWAKHFQREASPRTGLGAVRRGHVMQIGGGGTGAWVVYDPNSGRGLTRQHVRDLRGYVFVDP